MAKRPLVVVSSLIALTAACGGRVDGEKAGPVTSQSQPLDNGCVSASASGGWINGAIGAHSTPFTVDVDLSTATAPSDALFGLSDGQATTYTNLASIVRFNPGGAIDARNGGNYAADQSLPYSANVPLHFTIDLDPAAHTYSVHNGGTAIATNYAFRTEQAGTSVLHHFALKVDAGGPLSACNVTVTDACNTAEPNGGFVNTAFPTESVFSVTSFTATPNANDIDGEIGLSAASASSFNDLAAIVRFNPSGTIDVRNGDVYTADTSIPYSAGTSYQFHILTDVVGHSYSVFLNETLIAENYAFRTQQANVASLANWAMTSDSAVGSFSVCQFTTQPVNGTLYLHDRMRYAGTTAMAPAANGTLLLSSSTETLLADSKGLVFGTLPYGGTPAEDGQNDLYLAGEFEPTYDGGAGVLTSAGGRDVYVSKYDSAQHPLWSKRFGTANDDTLRGPAVNSEGDVLVGYGDTVARLDPSGNVAWSTVAQNTVFDLDPHGGAVFLNPSAQTVLKLDASGTFLWQKNYSGSGPSFVRSDPSGNVILAGDLDGTIDFGDGSLTLSGGENGSLGFIVELDPNGAFVSGHGANMNRVSSMTVDSAGRAILSGFFDNGFVYSLDRFADANGQGAMHVEQLIPGYPLGFGEDVAVDPSGSIFWQIDLFRPDGTQPGYLVRFAP
ncbi:MAG TPA: hypothetical protein VHV51_05240 [Polyangiaceae bacterium]|jgi:hypothetical protein|nr:hypothetical protein [Polyangiaceae bacterium]